MKATKRSTIAILMPNASQYSGVSAERRILPLHFSDGGFLPKAATLRNSRSVWTAVTSAPLVVRTEIIRLSKFSARSTAPLKPCSLHAFFIVRPPPPAAAVASPRSNPLDDADRYRYSLRLEHHRPSWPGSLPAWQPGCWLRPRSDGRPCVG